MVLLHSDELEKARVEYMDARTELQTEIDSNNKEDAIEMRSVVNVMESKVRYGCYSTPVSIDS